MTNRPQLGDSEKVGHAQPQELRTTAPDKFPFPTAKVGHAQLQRQNVEPGSHGGLNRVGHAQLPLLESLADSGLNGYRGKHRAKARLPSSGSS